jgi:hypothetical protein
VNDYKPGQSVRFSVEATLLGVLTNPPALALVVHAPDGTDSTPTPANDSAGSYHADFVIPFDGKPGVWAARWRATGTDPTQVALVESRFVVKPLDF